MILLLGGSGYIGSAFAAELRQRAIPFSAPTRADVDYTQFGDLLSLLRALKPALVINAAGFTGRPNVDACELNKADTLLGNTVLPAVVANACDVAAVPFAHISSGCIFDGTRIVAGETLTIERDLTAPKVRDLITRNRSSVRGFTEEDSSNFSFRQPPCSFYSGSKALAEEALISFENKYIWRLRIPFDEFDSDRNYLSKLQRYPRVYDNFNSLSHRGDFVRACLDLWECRSPFGTYNMTNPGFVSAREVVEMIQRILRPNRTFEFWKDDAEFYRVAVTTPRSNCILDVSKLLASGVRLRPVEEALENALKRWQPAAAAGVQRALAQALRG